MHNLINRENGRNHRARFVLANMPEPDDLIHLNHRQEYSLTGDHRYQSIVCISGSVWVTQENDVQDYLLQDDEVFIITSRGRVIVRALADSTIGLSPKIEKRSMGSRVRHSVFQ